MNNNETIEVLIAECRADADKMDAHELPQPTTGYLRVLLNRIEESCRRAYNEIDNAVCAAEDISSVDIDYIRKHIEQTIGDYYE